MDEYDLIKKSGLRFKGEKKRKKKSDRVGSGSETRNKEGKSPAESEIERDGRIADADDHGGWWRVTKYEQIRDDVAIEFLPGCYAKSLSNGRLVLGAPHPPGEGPDEEEIFTAMPGARINQVSFKTGFDRYLAIDRHNRLMGLSEAIAELESFLPVFEDNKTALCSSNDCFISVDEDSEIQQIVARSSKAGPNEMVSIRVPNDPFKLPKR